MRIRTAPELVRYLDQNTVKIHFETMNRLEYLRGRAAWLREQMEAATEECCYLLGCDFAAMDNAAEVAQEIIYCGMEVGDALDMIIKIKSGDME